MTENTIYYVCGHTASGFVNLIESNLVNINKVILLQHPSKQVIAEVLSYVKKEIGKEEPYEALSSPYFANQLEGIIFRNRSLAILTADVLEEKASDVTKLDLTRWFPMTLSDETKADTNYLQSEAYRHFAKALTIHDDLEAIYIEEMDFEKADHIANELLQQLFKDVPKKHSTAYVFERLFGTNTIDGAINKVEQIIDPIKHRFFVKGRAGTGKSVLLKKILEKSKQYGYDVELHRCSFDPNSIDMVLIPELDYCLFDSTAPHEFFPTRYEDQVIDLYEQTVTAGTDEKYKETIQHVTHAYKSEMKKGLSYLQKLKDYQPFKSMQELEINDEPDLFDDIIKEIIKLT